MRALAWLALAWLVVAPTTAQAQTAKIIPVFGDSITEFTPTGGYKSWAELLLPHATFVNEALGGQNSTWCLAQVRAYITAARPMDVALIMIGTNDYSGGGEPGDENQVLVPQTILNINTMVDEIAAYNGATAIVVSPPARYIGGGSPQGQDQVDALDELAAAMIVAAAQYDWVFVDVYTAWVAYGASAPPDDEDLTSDGLHPNSAGDLFIADQVRPTLLQYAPVITPQRVIGEQSCLWCGEENAIERFALNGNAVLFDDEGANDDAMMLRNAADDTTADFAIGDQWTLAAWVWIPDTDGITGTGTIFALTTDAANSRLTLVADYNNDSFRLFAYNDADPTYLKEYQFGTMTDEAWHFLGAQWDGTGEDLDVFQAGVEVVPDTTNPDDAITMANTARRGSIGARGGNDGLADNGCDCAVHQVAMWDTLLSDPAFLSLNNSGNGNGVNLLAGWFNYTATDVAGLVHWWAAGNSASPNLGLDISGHANAVDISYEVGSPTVVSNAPTG